MRRDAPRLLLITLAALVALLPIVWMLGISLSPTGRWLDDPLTILPASPTLAHYAALLTAEPLQRGLNSLTVAAGTTALALLLSFPAAYALVRLRWPAGLDVAFLLFVLLIKLAPPIVLAIPLYQILRTLGLLDTLAGLVLVYQVYALPFALWMLLGFVREVPFDYEEAAMLDGAGLLKRLRDIVLPLMVPGLVSTAIFVTILAWNEFLYALLFIQTPSNFTLPIYIGSLITEDETLWGRLCAVGALASLPILALVGLVQRGLTRGLAGGLK